jgi:hypothetical protein
MYIWGNGLEPKIYADEAAKEFDIAASQDKLYAYSFYSRNGLDRFKGKYANKSLTLWRLFPKSSDNRLFCKELKVAVGEMKRAYSIVSDQIAMTTRENRTTDFSNVVRFCNSNKVMVAKKMGFSARKAKLQPPHQGWCRWRESQSVPFCRFAL